MQKVLIIGPNFHNFNTSIARAFEILGWEIVIEGYDTPIHPFKGLLKWQNKFTPNKEKLKEKQKNKYKLYIEQRFVEEKPDIVFILNGDILHGETLDFFRIKSKVILWLFDSITNIPTSVNHIKHVDYCFCYEQEDVDYYIKLGEKAYFLPQAYDPQLYYLKIDTKKDIDILFIGNLYLSKRRQRYIQKIIKSFPEKKIVIIGEYKPWYKNPIKWLFREHRKIYMNKNIPYFEVNDYYNRALIVLNIHNEQQRNGANPKVFEISGSGAYQICDKNSYIASLFSHNEIGQYEDENRLVSCIIDALANDKTVQAQEAYNIVKSQHTFAHRIAEVLSVVSNNKEYLHAK